MTVSVYMRRAATCRGSHTAGGVAVSVTGDTAGNGPTISEMTLTLLKKLTKVLQESNLKTTSSVHQLVPVLVVLLVVIKACLQNG